MRLGRSAGTSPFVMRGRLMLPSRPDRARVLRSLSHLLHLHRPVASILLKHGALTRCGQSEKAFGR